MTSSTSPVDGQSTTVFIGNLPLDVSMHEVTNLIRPYCSSDEVEKIDIKSGYAFAFIRNDASRLLSGLHKSVYKNRTITVQYAKGE
eukprot:gene21064-25292_t